MVPALGFRIPPTLLAAGFLPSSFGPTHQLALLYIDALLGSPSWVLPPQKEHITSFSLTAVNTHRVRDADSCLPSDFCEGSVSSTFP